MGGFTREELAQRAGVSVDYVDRLVELRIVSPGEGSAPFSGGDLRRVRFVQAAEQGGIPSEVVGSAVQSGELSFDFFDAPFWDRFGGLAAETYRELSDETGLSPAQWLLQRRTERARELLEGTDLSVARVAREAGFGSATALRQRFHAALGVPPLSYRRTFAAR